jgi:hypothetical protein
MTDENTDQAPALTQEQVNEAIANAVAAERERAAAEAEDAKPKPPVLHEGDLVAHTVAAPWGEQRTVCRVVKLDEHDRVWLEKVELIGPLATSAVEADPEL